MSEARPETRLQIRIIPVTPLQQNCSLIWDIATKHAVLVDPGGDADTLMGALDHFGLTLKEMWLTHGHLDHARPEPREQHRRQDGDAPAGRPGRLQGGQ